MKLINQISPEALKGILEDQKARLSRFKDRIAVLENRYEHLVDTRIEEVYETEEVQNEIKLMALKRLRNTCRRIASVAFVAYQEPPQRYLEGEPEAVNIQWRELLDAAKVEPTIRQVGLYAWVANVVWVIVQAVKDGEDSLPRPMLETVLPEVGHALREDGKMYALVYRIPWEGPGERTPDDPHWGAVDSRAFYKLNERLEVLDEQEHATPGLLPVVEWRGALEPLGGDYYDEGRGGDLVEGSVETSRLDGHMRLVRRQQNSKMLVMYDRRDDDAGESPQDQKVNPNRGIKINKKKGDANVETVDMETLPDAFLREIREIEAEVAESYHVPSTWVDLTPGGDDAANTSAIAVENRNDLLGELRRGQIKVLEPSELEFGSVFAEVCYANDVPGAIDPDVVRSSYAVTFWNPAFADNRRLLQIELLEKRMSIGEIGPVEAVMELRPGISREEAERRLERTTQERINRERALSVHNLPGDASQDAETRAQAFGRQGGDQKAANAAAGESENEAE